MQRLIHVFAIATTMFYVAACATDDGTTSGDDQDTQSASIDQATPNATAAADTDWQSVAVDPSEANPSTCIRRIRPGNGAPCQSGFACLFQNSDFNGFGVEESSGCKIFNLQNVSCPACTNGTHGNDGTFNDQMSSWQNNTSREYCWYFNASFKGTAVAMSAMTGHANLASGNGDEASSLQPCSN